MKIKNIEFRLPWTRYVDMPIEAELYMAVRKSVLEDLLAEVEDAAQRVYANDMKSAERMADTEKKSRASVEPNAGDWEGSAYCVKCKEHRTFVGTIYISDSGRQMARGNCPVCDTRMNRILGKVSS